MQLELKWIIPKCKPWDFQWNQINIFYNNGFVKGYISKFDLKIIWPVVLCEKCLFIFTYSLFWVSDIFQVTSRWDTSDSCRWSGTSKMSRILFSIFGNFPCWIPFQLLSFLWFLSKFLVGIVAADQQMAGGKFLRGKKSQNELYHIHE